MANDNHNPCVTENVKEDENVFIKNAISGDVTAFEKLISAYQWKIYNFAYHLVGNESDARDLSQDSIIKVFCFLKNFRRNSSFSTWLWHIVHNTFLDQCRSSYKKHSLLTTSLESILYLKDNNPGPDKETENLDLQKQVERALLKLPVEYRMAVIMYDMQGFSYEEITAICKISIGTVKSRLNRGRKLLKKIILKLGTFF